MTLDIGALRADTPALRGPALPKVVHFNAASSGLVPAPVLAAMQDQLTREAMLAPHEAGVAAQPGIEAARAAAARLIGALPEEIAFAAGSSQGWNAAFFALPPLQPGDRVLVGRTEWGGNVFTLMREVARRGAVLEVIPAGPDGRIDTGALATMLDARVKLIAVTWAPAHIGLAEPAAEVGRIARAAGIPYLLDAAQALGLLPCNVADIGCDILTAPGRKALRGPKGTGLIYVRRDVLARTDPGWLNVRAAAWEGGAVVLRDDAGRFESNEFAPAALLGLGAALDLTNGLGVAAIHKATLERVGELRDALQGMACIRLCEAGPAQSHITTFTHRDMDAVALMRALRDKGVTVNAIAPGYAPLEAMAGPVCRASVSYLTTSDEIAALCAALEGVR